MFGRRNNGSLNLVIGVLPYQHLVVIVRAGGGALRAGEVLR
jgi:hypothetical protein